MARFHRAHLQKMLLESVPAEGVSLVLSKRVESVRVDPSADRDGVVLAFQDGTSFAADFLVGADGIHSGVRKALVPEHSLQWTGDVLFRSTFDASLVKGVEDLLDDAVFYSGPDGRYLFASRLVNTPGDMESLRALFKGWHPTVQKLLQATPATRVYPNHLGTSLESLVFGGRIALLGDAGHTHGGAFASDGSLAINDAHALALSLAHVWPAAQGADGATPDKSQLQGALALFDATRRPHVTRLIDVVHSGLAERFEKLRDPHRVEETDGELRARIAAVEGFSWLGEHDVEAEFRRAAQGDVAKL
ncbi:FAD/NAD(P)-binding domain-containing protein [Aspergillus pseudoustus]|uniref:FAD/NAD(P)-binding domain-containing protein n=1 Tax=Aspergillus pseudoustus TaxID=1810923 RepID=A0ABR4J973_9EURO